MADPPITSNTLEFINLSLNNAQQNKNFSYRPDGLPRKSEEEQLRHKKLVEETKWKYIESMKWDEAWKIKQDAIRKKKQEQ